jgi:signal transduction histidine kinase
MTRREERPPPRRTTRTVRLHRLAERVVEAPDLEVLARLLTRELPSVLGIPRVNLLVWDRKLESFESLSCGETRGGLVRSAAASDPSREARYLISDGELLETPGVGGGGALLPLMARSGMVGMLVLAERRGGRSARFGRTTLRRLTLLAQRAALAVENHIYHQELIATERLAALGTMAGMLAHDLRGPMTVIRGYAETLTERGVPPEEVVNRAETIMRMVDRLERMATETLDFARGGGRLARRAVDVSQFLNDLSAGLEEEIPRIEVVRDLRVPNGVRAALDVDKLRRAVGNVAANARDAMGGRGRFHVTGLVEDVAAGDAQRRLVLLLADEGPGVPPEIRERIFEPFVTHGKKGGTGLGLAVARRFVEDHGGTLELLAEGPGARFRISVPLGGPEGGAGIESER